MTILANDRREMLDPFLSNDEIEEVKGWSSSLSVVPEARLLRDLLCSCMIPRKAE